MRLDKGYNIKGKAIYLSKTGFNKKMKAVFAPFAWICMFLFSCSVSKNYNPDKKYSKEVLLEDYTLLRNILEKKHPSLYWYTSRDSMDMYFNKGYKEISDSMTEQQFGWKILAPLTNKIHCGHTSFSMSKGWGKYIRNKRIPSFPLYLKVWSDTMVVTANLNRKDSIIKKGAIITAINGVRSKELIKKMTGYLVEDGYADNVNYIRLSAAFPYFHRNIFGLYKTYSVQYIDSSGVQKNALIPLFTPQKDTTNKYEPVVPGERKKRLTRRQKLQNIRNLETDSAYNMAILKVNSFSRGHQLKFFRRSFQKIKENNIQNLVIDLRNNGGGEINNFVSLARYIRNKPFKVADTAAAISKNLRPYSRYIKAGFFDKLGLIFLTKKEFDNRYHFNYWEKNIKKPRRKNHFNGNVYVLTNGLTFSASTLFCNAVKGQPNVTLVGEETGGGWHGNSGIMIPDIVLPNTKLRVRLPMFRLVQYDHVPKNGTGIIPDVFAGPTLYGTRNNIDLKMKVVKQMISEKNQNAKQE